jgi:hypothetical protein
VVVCKQIFKKQLHRGIVWGDGVCPTKTHKLFGLGELCQKQRAFAILQLKITLVCTLCRTTFRIL